MDNNRVYNELENLEKALSWEWALKTFRRPLICAGNEKYPWISACSIITYIVLTELYQVRKSQELFVIIFKACLMDEVIYARICEYCLSPIFNCGVFVVNTWTIISYRENCGSIWKVTNSIGVLRPSVYLSHNEKIMFI